MFICLPPYLFTFFILPSLLSNCSTLSYLSSTLFIYFIPAASPIASLFSFFLCIVICCFLSLTSLPSLSLSPSLSFSPSANFLPFSSPASTTVVLVLQPPVWSRSPSFTCTLLFFALRAQRAPIYFWDTIPPFLSLSPLSLSLSLSLEWVREWVS